MNMTQGIVNILLLVICTCIFGIYGFIGSIVLIAIDESISKDKKYKAQMKEMQAIKAEIKKAGIKQ